MEIVWDPRKQAKLRLERGIDLDEIKGLIEDGKCLDILEHQTKADQVLLVLEYKSYVHLVPVKLEPDRMILKTCYPSRKANRKYKGSNK